MNLYVKYVFDYILSISLLIILSPIFLIIAVMIKLDCKGPALFKQERVGKDGKLFKIYKFRTMVDNAVNIEHGFGLEENDPRIAFIGKFLRKWSLDELPQLINVIKGEMSIIGPRPTLQYQVKQYNEFQKKRLLMKPGITGWAQVNGRNSLTWEERINFDVLYVECYTLWLDLEIFIKTIMVTILRKGLYGKSGVNEDFNPQKVWLKKTIS